MSEEHETNEQEEQGQFKDEFTENDDENEREIISTTPSEEFYSTPKNPMDEFGYENEWVRFLNELSNDKSLASIVDYIKEVKLTRRSKEELKVYIRTLLDKEFAISKIDNTRDLLLLHDDKNLIDADLYLGLLRYDITPEFQHIINLIRIKFGIKVRRSYGGFERRAISTQRNETITEERVKRTNQGNRGVGETLKELYRK